MWPSSGRVSKTNVPQTHFHVFVVTPEKEHSILGQRLKIDFAMYTLKGGVGRGEGGWDPQICVPKMAQQDFSNGNFVFSHDGHFGLGGGGQGGGGTSFAQNKKIAQALGAGGEI